MIKFMTEEEIFLSNIKPLIGCTKILVTGPQRSGTRITTKIIANILNMKYLQEEDMELNSLSKLFSYLLSNKTVAIQCPQMSSICHLIDTDNTGLIFMKRPIHEIKKSQLRIMWGGRLEKKELNRYFKSDGEACTTKYEVWEKFQKNKIKIPFCEIKYGSLSFHKFWVNKPERSKFKFNQTS